MKRARSDLEIAIGYLYTRVSTSNKDGWKKLRRIVVFVKSNIDDTKLTGTNNLTKKFTWIGEAYTFNPDMRS